MSACLIARWPLPSYKFVPVLNMSKQIGQARRDVTHFLLQDWAPDSSVVRSPNSRGRHPEFECDAGDIEGRSD